MIRGQLEPSGQQPHLHLRKRSALLRHHPVLLPATLILGSIVLFIASFHTAMLFPLLAIVGAPTALLCLSVAIVLGIVGILASIIGILESIDRTHTQTTTFSKPKGA